MYMSSICTVECRYNAIQCYKIFHTALRGLKHDTNQGSKSHIIPHISPQWASFGVTCVRIKMKIDRVITAPHCIVTLCKLVMFHAYDQVAVHVYLYWTQDNRRYIFCPGSFSYCKHRFILTQYVFMFWNINFVFKLTTIDVPSGLRARNFQSSVIHHHEFSLIGKFNVYTCIWETLFEKPN